MVFPPLLWSFPPTAAFTSFAAPDCWACATLPAFPSQLVYLQLMWEVGLPPSPVEFSSHHHFCKLSHSWLLGMCDCSCLLQPDCCEGFPFPYSSALRAPCLLCYMSFLLLLLIIQFFVFFPWEGVGLSREICWSGPGLSVGVAHDTKLTFWSMSSQAIGALQSGSSPGALLVSLFNVKWRCYAQPGSVEESKFCLFSVVFPVRCISSVSPRFYFRCHGFCFLPFAVILESLIIWSS
jgi:hypothetical protein